MSSIRLSRREIERDWLPNVCVVCGEHAHEYRETTFRWNAPWVWLLIFAITPILALFILALICKRMPAHMPMCFQHRNYWLWRRLIPRVLVLVALGSITIGIALSSDRDPTHWSEVIGVLLVVRGAVGAFEAVVSVLVLHFTSIHAIKITPNEIMLVRVAVVFVNAVKAKRLAEGRDAEEEFDDEDGWR